VSLRRDHQRWVVAGTSPVSGLVHISELSWDPVRNPRDLLEEGQNVRVKVLQVDK
jgi:ribosomal protein S1